MLSVHLVYPDWWVFQVNLFHFVVLGLILLQGLRFCLLFFVQSTFCLAACILVKIFHTLLLVFITFCACLFSIFCSHHLAADWTLNILKVRIFSPAASFCVIHTFLCFSCWKKNKPQIFSFGEMRQCRFSPDFLEGCWRLVYAGYEPISELEPTKTYSNVRGALCRSSSEAHR